VVAVSPIVGGAALKGPAAKIMHELGVGASSLAVARHYAARGPIDGLLLDERDAAERDSIEALGVAARTADTVMLTLDDQERVASAALELARALRPRL
jgi:LPPG:FO 2-phospho-L-lactate transferase